MSAVAPPSAPAADEGREFLARCVAGTSGNPALEHIREQGADAVLALYRLIKISLIHSSANDAVGRTIEQAHAVLVEYATLAGGIASITFVDETIFVCGQLLRASRMVYESAAELGELFQRCRVSEISIEASVTREALAELTRATAATLRDPSLAAQLTEARIPAVTLRQVESVLTRNEKDENMPLRGRFLRLYASALVVMRRFFDGIASGTTVLPHRVKRLSQGFVGLAEKQDDAALLGLTAMANAHRDDAGRAVQSAILAVAVAKQVTTDRVALARLAMAAMLADVGRVRLAGVAGRDRFVPLPDADDEKVPAMASAIAIATGGVSTQSALRTVVTFETTWMEREKELGPLYKGALTPLLQSRILHVVRAVLDRLAPRDITPSMSILDALEDVARAPSVDRAVLKLLVKAVGLTPVGSVVELETGDWAVVVAPSENPSAHDRPRVRIVMDRGGRVIDPPLELDLGAPPPGKSYPRVSRIVEPQEARFNVARAFVGE